MRSFMQAYLSILMIGLLSLVLPLSGHADEDAYRLLELDGHMVKWGDRQLGVGASITYAFAGESLSFDNALNCREMTSFEALSGGNLSIEMLAREARAAFRVWEHAADLSFHEVGDVRDADIILGAQGLPRGRAFANVSYAPDPEDGVRAIEQALVCLNPEHKWKVGFDGDEDVYDIRYTLIHEIGHAIGLDHPGPAGQVMAFRYTEDFNELQAGDLRGIRQLYGHSADDGRLAHGFDTHLTRYPMEAVHANNQIGQPLTGMTEGQEIESISNLVSYQVGSLVAIIVNVSYLLGIGEKDFTLDWAPVMEPQMSQIDADD